MFVYYGTHMYSLWQLLQTEVDGRPSNACSVEHQCLQPRVHGDTLKRRRETEGGTVQRVLGEVEEGEAREGGQDGQHLSGGRKGGREGLSVCLVVQVLSGNTCT